MRRRERFAGFTLLWPVSFDARQQLLFEPGPGLPEPLSLSLEIIEKVYHLAVLGAKRVEFCVCRH